jgi:HAD superfamily hydrolase (TIGR01458 family)
LLLNAGLRGDFAPFVGRAADVDYVVVGDLRDAVSYSALNDAFRHLRAGAKLIALQKGRYFVRSDGEYLDTGAFVELLEYASGRQALVLGKPSPSFFELALAELGCAPEETLVVGDDISTDVAGAHAIGARSVLVRTGKYDPLAVETAAIAPSAIVDSVADLPELLARWQHAAVA